MVRTVCIIVASNQPAAATTTNPPPPMMNDERYHTPYLSSASAVVDCRVICRAQPRQVDD